MSSYQCRMCLAFGDGRSFSEPDTDYCDLCLAAKRESATHPLSSTAVVALYDLVAPFLTRYGQPDAGDLARAVMAIVDAEKPDHECEFDTYSSQMHSCCHICGQCDGGL